MSTQITNYQIKFEDNKSSDSTLHLLMVTNLDNTDVTTDSYNEILEASPLYHTTDQSKHSNGPWQNVHEQFEMRLCTSKTLINGNEYPSAIEFREKAQARKALPQSALIKYVPGVLLQWNIIDVAVMEHFNAYINADPLVLLREAQIRQKMANM